MHAAKDKWSTLMASNFKASLVHGEAYVRESYKDEDNKVIEGWVATYRKWKCKLNYAENLNFILKCFKKFFNTAKNKFRHFLYDDMKFKFSMEKVLNILNINDFDVFPLHSLDVIKNHLNLLRQKFISTVRVIKMCLESLPWCLCCYSKYERDIDMKYSHSSPDIILIMWNGNLAGS